MTEWILITVLAFALGLALRSRRDWIQLYKRMKELHRLTQETSTGWEELCMNWKGRYLELKDGIMAEYLKARSQKPKKPTLPN